MMDLIQKPTAADGPAPWNKGKLIGQKPPLKLNEVWSIRARLQIEERIRDLALFNLAIDTPICPHCEALGRRHRS